jgi:hypothetical protein
MKTDYEYLTRRLLRTNGEIRYELNIVLPNNVMECLTVFRAVPGKNNFRLIEERGKDMYFYGQSPREEVDSTLKELADKFQVDDFMARLEAMRGKE